MLSVNRSSVLLPWLEPNTLWLAWNSCLQAGEEERDQMSNGFKQVPGIIVEFTTVLIVNH